MTYILSKIFGLLLLPSTLILLMLVLGLIFLSYENGRRWGLRFLAIGTISLAAVGFLPLGNWVIMPLESRFAGTPLPEPGADIAGTIILGGFEDGWVSAGRHGLAVNEAAERLTEGMLFAKRWPKSKVVFTGGVGGLLAGGIDAAKPVAKFLRASGISPDRIVLESKSRNTYQNALFTKELLKPSPDETWVLITSAYHMPRSVGVFRKADFKVIPAPVDFRTRDYRDVYRMFERIPSGLERLDVSSREWVGLLAYWLMGRTDALFPAPKNT